MNIEKTLFKLVQFIIFGRFSIWTKIEMRVRALSFPFLNLEPQIFLIKLAQLTSTLSQIDVVVDISRCRVVGTISYIRFDVNT